MGRVRAGEESCTGKPESRYHIICCPTISEFMLNAKGNESVGILCFDSRHTVE